MTDRLKGVIVTFDHDIREDKAQAIINAIRMLKGVLAVDVSVRDHNDIMNRRLIETALRERLWDALKTEEE